MRFAKHGLLSLAGLACLQMIAPVFAQTVPEAKVAPVASASADPSWQEEYAYTLGVQAYVFGFPWVYLPTLRWLWVTQPRNPERVPYAPLNQFWHGKTLVTAAYRDGGSPNNDTLYSMAWLDLSKEPLILSVPETGKRYYTMEMASLDSDNFAYVGLRTTGSHAGSYAIIGPHWKGKLPKGVKALPPSRTNAALIFGRTLIAGPQDLAAANKIQSQYILTPLSLWGKPVAKLVDDRSVWAPVSPKTDPLGDWKTMNRAMTEDPPTPSQLPLVQMFRDIGVGPGLDVEKMNEATKRGLARAAVKGKELLTAATRSFYGASKVNGWLYPSTVYGRAGLAGEFLIRGGPQCLGGIIANEPEEAIYIPAFDDITGQKLDGNKKYVIHFAPGGLPPVDAFWSLTMYGMDYNLVDNPLNRYALGDRSAVKRDDDGSITIHVQNESPGAEHEANWLPAPKANFYLVLRTYIPQKPLLERRWVPPAVTPNE